MDYNFQWTAAMTPVLVQLVYRGLGSERIAAIIGCPVSVIEERFYGGDVRHVSDLTRQEKIWMRANFRKTAYEDIQLRLGVSLASLMLIAICMGLRKRSDGKGWSQLEYGVLKRLRDEGKDVNECAAFLGRAKKGIEHKLYDKKEHFVLAQERGRKLDEKQLEWFLKHYPHTSNSDIQRRFGISFSYLHRLAREHGLSKTSKFLKKTQDAAQQAAAESHRANGTYPPKGYHIPGSEKHCFKKGVTNEMRLGKVRNKKRIEKSANSLARRRRRERLLASCGLPQKTKLRVVKQPKEKISYCHGLRKLGYIQDERDKNLWYYPADGTRRPIKERHGEKHGIRFRPKSIMHVETSDPDKVRSDKIRFVKMETLFGEPKKERARNAPEAAFGCYPVSTKIVSSLSSYSNENTFLYEE